MFNIVLLEPRMPGNVGTIGRLAYATGSILHLIKPYGFGEINEKQVSSPLQKCNEMLIPTVITK